MKKFFAVALTTLAAGPIVHPPVAKAASETVCTSSGVADAGYQLTISADLKTAVLDEETIAGPRKVADMDCERLLETEQFMPDAIHNYLLCRDARAPEAGMIVRVYNGGLAGLHYASVREATVLRGKVIEKEVQFGHLNCR